MLRHSSHQRRPQITCFDRRPRFRQRQGSFFFAQSKVRRRTTSFFIFFSLFNQFVQQPRVHSFASLICNLCTPFQHVTRHDGQCSFKTGPHGKQLFHARLPKRVVCIGVFLSLDVVHSQPIKFNDQMCFRCFSHCGRVQFRFRIDVVQQLFVGMLSFLAGVPGKIPRVFACDSNAVG